ncbi:MAG: efflux RND transporter periplasmic adaptor subunit [Rikenellaceae bacterium]
MKRTQIIASLLAASVLISCGGKGDKAVEVKEEVQVPKVTVETVYSQDVEQTNTLTGTVESKVINNIAPQTALRIKEILVEVGDKVNKGQKLVTMDDNQLKQIAVQLENNRIEFERIDELYKIGGVSKSEWDARKLALDISTENYNNQSINTVLTSPISGVVTARNLDNGDMYSGGSAILVVEQINPVKLVVNVSESMFTKITKGMSVNVTTEAYGNQVFTGRVSLIHPKIDVSTRTFPVEIEVSNSDNKILPGMFARVNISYGVENRVLVPDVAIVKQTGSGDRYVYVYKNGTVEFCKVELGRMFDNQYEILSGLSDGDQVITSGHVALTNGMQVQTIK